MTTEILKLLTDSTIMFMIGIVIGFISAMFIVWQYMEVKNKQVENPAKDELEEGMDGYGNNYYVCIPGNNDPIQIDIEEPVGIGHFIILDKIKYKVQDITHKVNGHTLILLGFTHDLEF